MTREVHPDLAGMLSLGEEAIVEIKRSLTKHVGRTLRAFANAGNVAIRRVAG